MRFSDGEWEAIVVASAREGWEPNAWVQQVAYERAVQLNRRPDGAPVPEAVREAADLRRLLKNIGGNVNDLAKVANSTGELASEELLRAVMEVLIKRTHRVDSVLAKLVGEPLS